MSRHRRRPRKYNPEEFEESLNMVEGHAKKLVRTIFRPVFIGFGSLIFLLGVVVILINVFGLGSNPDTTTGVLTGCGIMAVGTLFVMMANFIFSLLGRDVKQIRKVHERVAKQEFGYDLGDDGDEDEENDDEFREPSIPEASDRKTILKLANRTPRRVPFGVTARIYLAGFWNQFGILFYAIASAKLAFWIVMLDEAAIIMKLIVASVAMLPIAGLAIWGKGLVNAIRSSSLLKQGAIVGAKFANKKPMAASVNGRQVMKLTFQFRGPDGNAEKCEVSTPEPEQFSQKEIEYAVYMPSAPQNNVMLKGIPGSPILGQSGQLHSV